MIFMNISTIRTTLRRALPVLVLINFLCIPISSLSSQNGAEVPNQSETVTLALENADIRDLIRWAQDVTGKSIIVHPNVTGKVTVLAGDPMSRTEAYQVFLSVLQVHGFALLEADNNLKIIPDALAKQSSVPIVNSSDPSAREDVIVRIIKVKNVSASQLVNFLRPLVPQVGHLAAYPSTNALILADRANNIDKIVEIISRLDKVGITNIERIKIEYANAKEIHQVISKLLPNSQGKGAENVIGIQLAVDERSNSLLMTGDPATRQQIRALIQDLDQPLSGDGNTQVFYLNYADATELVGVLQSISGSVQKSKKDQSSEAEVSIESNEALNALIVTAPPSILNTIKGVIGKMDIRRPQVLVEALIVEVNEDLGHELGIEWLSDSNSNVRGSFSAFPTLTSRPNLPPDVTFNSGFNLGYFRGGELRGLINALATESQANILSTPTIMALDNEEARILVGQNVPFITGSEARNNDDPFQTIERQDVGITLKVKPRVNRDNAVTLDIEQSVESVTESARASDIITNKREIQTRVLINNNETLVLGGLIRDELEEVERKVPLLGDIPVMGRLFKSTGTNTVKRNLMVFIRPTIISNSKQGYDLTSERYHSMQSQQQDFRNKIETYFVPREIPVLPEMKHNQPSTIDNSVNSLQPRQPNLSVIEPETSRQTIPSFLDNDDD